MDKEIKIKWLTCLPCDKNEGIINPREFVYFYRWINVWEKGISFGRQYEMCSMVNIFTY